MKKQILIIHGGMTYDSYKEYISSLKNREVDESNFKLKTDWKNSIEKKLGEAFEVFVPRMPNGSDAKYKEWEIWFNRVIPFIKNNVILVGHSLGGIFLAKYLSQNIYTKKIKALILVAAPFTAEGTGESLGDFVLPNSLKKLENQVSNIYLFQSKDDPVVPYEQVNKYKEVLPDSKIITLEDRKHFNQESFPELIRLIKNIK